MERRETETKKKTRRRSFFYWFLTVALLLVALLLSAVFVVVCAAYSKVHPFITIELGADSPEVSAFARGDAKDLAYGTQPEAKYKAAGDYRLSVKTGILTVPVLLRVVDTVPPTATGTETTISTLQSPTPDKLIKHLRDESVVKVTFETAPEYGRIGDYDAVVLLEDASGNQSRVPVKVHIRVAAESIAAEAGDPAPKAEAFLIDHYETVELNPDPETLMHTPGEHTIRITADGTETESKLIVRDTVPPTGRGVTRIAGPDDELRAEDFVTDIQDETAVTAAFATPPDPESRVPQTLEIVLKDRGGNETRVGATLLITGVTPIEIEAHAEPLSVSELHLEGTYRSAEIAEPFVPDEPGEHVVIVTIDGKQNLALIDVRDTTPPSIEIVNTSGILYHPMPVEALASATDVTGAKLGYKTEPDWSKETQDVTVYAVDAAGNRTERTFTLTLVSDTEPPELYGVVNRTAYVGEPIVYLDEVYAEDAVDGRVKVTVESDVQTDKPGKYNVVYTAEDLSGNRVSAECRFTLVEATVTEDEVHKLAQEVLGEIVTDGMVTAEKLKAVYDYVRGHIHYVNSSDKTDWRKEAVRGLKTGKGDCFTFYSVTRALLDELDVEYMSLTRLGGRTRHYWVIVNIGTGWYHYDPTVAPRHKHKCFMWTNEQCKVKAYFWRYDHSKYPDIATEKFDYDEVVRLEKEGKLP